MPVGSEPEREDGAATGPLPFPLALPKLGAAIGVGIGTVIGEAAVGAVLPLPVEVIPMGRIELVGAATGLALPKDVPVLLVVLLYRVLLVLSLLCGTPVTAPGPEPLPTFVPTVGDKDWTGSGEWAASLTGL